MRIPDRPSDSLARAYDAAYATPPNWDIGRPQRAFVHLEEAGLIDDPVLDVGCGTGELSLFLASRGHRVLGIDIARLAVEQARAKAHWRRIPAQFLVWDVLQLPALAEAGVRVRSVVDSAMFHVLGDDDRARFVEGLATVLESGGRYLVLGDAHDDPTTWYGISPEELRGRFRERDGWRVEVVVDAVVERRWGSSRAYLGVVTRL